MTKIKDAIKAIVREELKHQVFSAKVISVDDQDQTCDVEIEGEHELYDVRLRSIIDQDNKGVIVYPSVGSYVLVGIIDNRIESSYICATSTVSKVQIMTDDIELAGDQFGGLVKAEVVNAEVNALKQEINTFKQLLTAWVPVPTDGGASLKTFVASWAGQLMTPNTQVDYENQQVKHG